MFLYPRPDLSWGELWLLRMSYRTTKLFVNFSFLARCSWALTSSPFRWLFSSSISLILNISHSLTIFACSSYFFRIEASSSLIISGHSLISINSFFSKKYFFPSSLVLLWHTKILLQSLVWPCYHSTLYLLLVVHSKNSKLRIELIVYCCHLHLMSWCPPIHIELSFVFGISFLWLS